MKSIVSSKYLHDAIKKALNQKKINVVVTPNLLKLGKIECELHSIDNVVGYYSFEFDNRQWIEFMLFLYRLPEQPITCVFDNEKVSIYCVIEFRL